jgi:hypothetical protein
MTDPTFWEVTISMVLLIPVDPARLQGLDPLPIGRVPVLTASFFCFR